MNDIVLCLFFLITGALLLGLYMLLGEIRSLRGNLKIIGENQVTIWEMVFSLQAQIKSLDKEIKK